MVYLDERVRALSDVGDTSTDPAGDTNRAWLFSMTTTHFSSLDGRRGLPPKNDEDPEAGLLALLRVSARRSRLFLTWRRKVTQQPTMKALPIDTPMPMTSDLRRLSPDTSSV